MRRMHITPLIAILGLVLSALLLVNCAPTAAQPARRQGGTVTLALSQEPDTLNPYLASQRAAGEVHTFVVQGLLGVNEKGEFYPVLATDVPTQENSGVSADGLTITYHLRQGIQWSDGQPFTCDDVRFTWQAVVHPKSGAVGTSGYREIESVTCPDAHTAVIKFQTFYAGYLVPFWAILPRHATGDPSVMARWDYNRRPVGTGPFQISEWVSGDHITLVPNPNYRGQPQLDSVVIQFVPSREVALQLLQTAQVTIVGDLVEANLPQLANAPGIAIDKAPSPRSERLLLNLADPNIDTPAEPLKQPHPILADPRVREALELAINKQEIVDHLLFGQATVGTNELNSGAFKCDAPFGEFNPDRARQLLDQAGWRLGADGVRVAEGAPFASDGTRLRLKLQGPSGDALREQVEQVLLDRWKEVGVEAYIENAPTAALFGTWESGSVARHGKFDILIYTTGLPIPDPHSQIETYFASWQIPLASNKGAGYNYSRWINPLADAAIKSAGRTPDLATRRAGYCQVMAEVNRDRPQIYLYARNALVAYRDRLQGVKLNVWKNLGWNAAEWKLRQ
ncbi:MAG: peptide ABC transporter substrate-binding protein [Chloroflexi bacterium]|nr:peptide ABC transporter substrate-binding protein [Chloroflexota bacterium]